MPGRELSAREQEIIDLSAEGLTNEAIGSKMGISVGTVNTYWLRIRLKIGSTGRTDTVARIIKDRAEQGLRDSNIERQELETIIAEQEKGLIDLRAALALLHLAMSQIKSTVWATDRKLLIRIIANGKAPSTHCGVVWDVGKTVYEIFKTKDKANPAVAAHLGGLEGKESNIHLTGEFSNMTLRVEPLRDEAGAVIGCVSVLNIVGDREHAA
ncbi:MAG: helix-turn-helix domain-containing protein [Fimbriimonadaceae bacterium]